MADEVTPFAWAADTPAPVQELLKSKGMWDDPAKGAHSLATSYFELNKAHSAGNMIALPAADADDKAWEPVYSKMGRPETPDKYPELKSKHAGTTDDVKAFARTLAHKWGVPASKIQQGFDAWEDFAIKQNENFMTKSKADNDTAVTGLKTSMGAEKFDASVGNASKFFKTLASQKDAAGKPMLSVETMSAIERGMGSFALLEMFAAIGQRMGGEGQVIVTPNTPAAGDPTQMTPEQAKTEIDRLNADPAHQKAYWNAKEPGHKEAVEKMKQLFEAQHRRAA